MKICMRATQCTTDKKLERAFPFYFFSFSLSLSLSLSFSSDEAEQTRYHGITENLKFLLIEVSQAFLILMEHSLSEKIAKVLELLFDNLPDLNPEAPKAELWRYNWRHVLYSWTMVFEALCPFFCNCPRA